jgi:hypothetical protein
MVLISCRSNCLISPWARRTSFYTLTAIGFLSWNLLPMQFFKGIVSRKFDTGRLCIIYNSKALTCLRLCFVFFFKANLQKKTQVQNTMQYNNRQVKYIKFSCDYTFYIVMGQNWPTTGNIDTFTAFQLFFVS